MARSHDGGGAFEDKQAAREFVWRRLEESGAAAFPFPPRGRIPNFQGAAAAAERLLAHALFDGVRRIKINPDAPQRFVRARALRRGIELLVPTPRLRGGFRRLDPERIPHGEIRSAVTLSGMQRWGETVALDALPGIDLIVTGCAAVTRAGKRCGKGEGYSDLEFAVLRELGHPEVPVVTTVHPLQIVEDLPRDEHDLALTLIVTPEEAIEVHDPLPSPTGIDWTRLTEADLEAMPILAELRARRRPEDP